MILSMVILASLIVKVENQMIVDPLLVEQLETAIDYSIKTENQFNIALGKLIDLWKQKEIENILPTEKENQYSIRKYR